MTDIITTTTSATTAQAVNLQREIDKAYKRGVSAGSSSARTRAEEENEQVAKRIAAGRENAKQATADAKAECIEAIISTASAEADTDRRQALAVKMWLESGVYKRYTYNATTDSVDCKGVALLNFADLDKAYRLDSRKGRLYASLDYTARLNVFCSQLVQYAQAEADSLHNSTNAPTRTALSKAGDALYASMFGPDVVHFNRRDIDVVLSMAVRHGYKRDSNTVTVSTKSITALKTAIQDVARWIYAGRPTSCNTSNIDKVLTAVALKSTETASKTTKASKTA